MGVEGILDIVIPLGVFFFLGASLYKELKEPIDSFINAIKRIFRGKGGEGGQENFGEEDNYVYYPKY